MKKCLILSILALAFIAVGTPKADATKSSTPDPQAVHIIMLQPAATQVAMISCTIWYPELRTQGGVIPQWGLYRNCDDGNGWFRQDVWY